MQKLILPLIFTAILTSCGSSEAEEKKPETYEEKVKAVCDCFKEKTGGQRMECAKMQDEFSDAMEGEEKKKFLLETNDCM